MTVYNCDGKVRLLQITGTNGKTSTAATAGIEYHEAYTRENICRCNIGNLAGWCSVKRHEEPSMVVPGRGYSPVREQHHWTVRLYPTQYHNPTDPSSSTTVWTPCTEPRLNKWWTRLLPDYAQKLEDEHPRHHIRHTTQHMDGQECWQKCYGVVDPNSGARSRCLWFFHG